jgi:arylformamidase
MVKAEWVDISIPLRKEMVHWPTDPFPPSVDFMHHQDKDTQITTSQVTINSHHGTHIDAPRHFNPNGTSIDEMPLDTIMGPVRVIEIKDTESIKPEELEAYDIQPGERILFKTKNSSYYKLGKFVEDFVYISNEAAHYLYEKKISVVGIDYYAIGSFRDRESLVEVHEVLVGNGIWAIEGLNLSDVEPGNYEIICLPVNIEGGDAGWCRPILRLVQ